MRFTITEAGPETAQHKASHNTSRKKWRETNPPASRLRFVGVDGEGVTFPDGTHRYVLLGIGQDQITNPDGLTWQECFRFLYEHKQPGPVCYAGFFLGYDFVQILKTLREERARMLLTAAGQAKRRPKSKKMSHVIFPVRSGGWEFDILGSKRLKFRPEGKDNPWMYICDAGSFFQKSFLKVIDPGEWSEPIVSPDDYAIISEGKAKRSSAVLDSDMMLYNRMENKALADVMERLSAGIAELGIYLKPNQWFGPGQAAQEWLRPRAITSERLQEVTPRGALEAARASYFGGWFEIMAHGLVPGTTYEYDINSAYPHIISTLPCLEHGTWRQGDWAENHRYCLVKAHVYGNDGNIGAMPHRDAKGNIMRPVETEGWYWFHELKAAVKAGVVDRYSITDSWSYHPCDCPPPLRETRDIYALRKRVGKKTPLGIACKLVPNSLYGKFAQSVGKPIHGNPVYASLITAGCRTMILDAIATHPRGTRDVLMVATDGVYFRSPHPALSVSGELGDWEEERKENITLFKPGVYWDDKARETIAAGEAPVFKARGVNARDFASQLSVVDQQFRELAESRPERISWPEVSFPLGFSMITAVQALQRGKWELAGTLISDPQAKQSSNPSLKRIDWRWENGIIRSKPMIIEPYEASHPYEKRFGLDDPFSQESEENNGTNPDGLPGNLVKEVLYDA